MPIVPSSTSTIPTTTTKPPSYSIPVTRPTLAHGDHNRVKHSGVPTRNNHSPTNAFIFLLFLRILRSLQSHITHLARINLPRKEEPYPLLALLVLLHQLGMVLPFYLLQPVHLMLVMHLQGASSPSYGGSPKPKLLPFPPISLPPPTSPSYGVSPIPKLPPSPQLSPHHLLLGLNLLSPLPPPLRLLVLHASIQSIDPILIIGHHYLHHHHQQILKLLLATLHCYPTKICHHHHCLHHHHQQILKLLLDTLHHHPTKIHHLPLVQLHYPLPPSSYVKPSPRFRPPPQPPSIPKMPPNHHQTPHHIPPPQPPSTLPRSFHKPVPSNVTNINITASPKCPNATNSFQIPLGKP